MLQTIRVEAQTHINSYSLPSFGSPLAQVEWSSSTKDPFGNVIFAGHTVISSTQIGVLVAKFSPTGDTLWQKTWLAAGENSASTSFGILVKTDDYGHIYVVGAAALLLSYHNSTAPNNYEKLAPEDVEFVLEHSAKDVGPTGWGEKNANGRLDAVAAFEYIRKPDRLIRHFGTSAYPYSITQNLIDSDAIVKFTEPYRNKFDEIVFQKNTEYKANIHKYTAIVSHNVDQIWAIAEQWERHSSSFTFPYYDDVTGNLLPHEKVRLLSVDQNTATLEGYLYEVKDQTTGNLIGWAPVSPADLEMEYSLLLSKESITFTDDKQPSNGPEVFPNPATQFITIVMSIPGFSEISLSLLDVRGVNIRPVFKVISGQELFEHSIPLDGIPPGCYFLRIVTKDGVFAQPIIKINH